MKNSYLYLVRTGKNNWWRYCLGIVFIVVFSAIFGGLLFDSVYNLCLLLGFEIPNTQYTRLLPRKTINASLILGVFITVKWFHYRKISTLVSVDGKLSIKQLFVGTIIGVTIMSLVRLFFGLFYSFDLETLYQLKQWPWLLLLIILTFLQSAGEELVFRGYLLQGFSLLTRNTFSLVCLSSLAFVFSHFTPQFYVSLGGGEIYSFIKIFLLGAICTIATLKDKRIETAIGIHFGHNLLVHFLHLAGYGFSK